MKLATCYVASLMETWIALFYTATPKEDIIEFFQNKMARELRKRGYCKKSHLSEWESFMDEITWDGSVFIKKMSPYKSYTIDEDTWTIK